MQLLYFVAVPSLSNELEVRFLPPDKILLIDGVVMFYMSSFFLRFYAYSSRSISDILLGVCMIFRFYKPPIF
jgi:hypothetical protein